MRMNRGNPKGDDLPINYVSWWDAIWFCNSLRRRFISLGSSPALNWPLGWA